ncbi:MAG: FecR domain-containing protein [Bacteroidales bacterium]|nr:FecR domain-containing protein [Bacteroidales bacterium]
MNERIEKYIVGELGADEQKLFLQHVQTDQSLREELIDAINTCAVVGLATHAKDAENARQSLRKLKKMVGPKQAPWVGWMGYALAVCVGIVATLLLTHERQTIDYTQCYQEFRAPAGQRAQLTLPDGTVVWLNANTTVSYPQVFAENERHIKLNGEAFFDVAHNKQQPFVVETSTQQVRVLGTKFNVFDYNDNKQFTVALIDGSVELLDKTGEKRLTALKPWERVDIIDGKATRSQFTNDDFLQWKQGIYSFDNWRFGDIVGKLELYYDVRIVMKSEALKNFMVNGKFRQRDGIESVLRNIQKIYPMKYTKDSETNIITLYDVSKK